MNEEINLTDQEIADYFKVNSRQLYITHIRRQCIKWLRSKGYTYQYIALLVFGRYEAHADVIYHDKRATDIDCDIDWADSIKHKLYPLTAHKRIGNRVAVAYTFKDGKDVPKINRRKKAESN